MQESKTEVEVGIKMNEQGPKLNREQRRRMAKQKKGELKHAQKMAESVSWTEADDIYEKCKLGLTEVNGLFVLLDDVFQHLTDADKEYATQTKAQLVQDIEQLKQELEAIRNMHAGKTTQCDIEDIMDFFSVAQAYETWTSRLEMIVHPASDSILDICQRGSNSKMAVEQAEQQTS